jgi:hypothetical protein
MKIYVVGSSKNKFLPLDSIREKYLIDEEHKESNIDFLNRWYCELTGLYYLWRNNTDNVIGLEHYRRYFVDDNNALLNSKQINDILKTHDVILRKYTFAKDKPNALSHFSTERKPYMLDFISKLEPNDSKYLYNKLASSHYFAQCNMFIGKREVIDAYCKWLFPRLLLMPFEQFTQSPRLIGYLAEFVFGFWLEQHGYKIYWCKSITV